MTKTTRLRVASKLLRAAEQLMKDEQGEDSSEDAAKPSKRIRERFIDQGDSGGSVSV